MGWAGRRRCDVAWSTGCEIFVKNLPKGQKYPNISPNNMLLSINVGPSISKKWQIFYKFGKKFWELPSKHNVRRIFGWFDSFHTKVLKFHICLTAKFATFLEALPLQRWAFSNKIKIPCRNQVSTCLLNIEWWNILAEIRSYCKHQDIITFLEAFVLHSNKTLHFHESFCPTSEKICQTNGTWICFLSNLRPVRYEWMTDHRSIHFRFCLCLGDFWAAFRWPPGNLRAASGQPLGSLWAASGQPLGRQTSQYWPEQPRMWRNLLN